MKQYIVSLKQSGIADKLKLVGDILHRMEYAIDITKRDNINDIIVNDDNICITFNEPIIRSLDDIDTVTDLRGVNTLIKHKWIDGFPEPRLIVNYGNISTIFTPDKHDACYMSSIIIYTYEKFNKQS